MIRPLRPYYQHLAYLTASVLVVGALATCSDGGKGVNEACESNGECGSGICHRGVCTAKQPWTNGIACEGPGECRSSTTACREMTSRSAGGRGGDSRPARPAAADWKGQSVAGERRRPGRFATRASPKRLTQRPQKARGDTPAQRRNARLKLLRFP